MTNIYLYSPEANQANIRLRDPTTVVPRYGVPVISGGAPPGRTVYYQSLFAPIIIPFAATALGWLAPLSPAPAVAKAQQGSSFVPFNTFQINTQTIDKWQSPLSIPLPVAKALPGNTFVPFDTTQTNTQRIDKWQVALSKPVPVAQAQQGNSFVPLNTFQINTASVDKWLVPLSIAVPVTKTVPTWTFVPFNTAQLNAYSILYLQPLSGAPPVASAQQGNTFVPFNTAQVSVNFTPFGWHQALSGAPPVVPQQYIAEPPQFGEIATSATVHVTVGDVGRHAGGRYRERTTYNVDKQRFETLLIEIRDDEAVPSKAKTAIAAVKKAKAVVLGVVATREIGPDQALELARLLENARAASKAMAAIENARLAMAYAQKLMDEQDDEEESMILLSMS